MALGSVKAFNSDFVNSFASLANPWTPLDRGFTSIPERALFLAFRGLSAYSFGCFIDSDKDLLGCLEDEWQVFFVRLDAVVYHRDVIRELLQLVLSLQTALRGHLLKRQDFLLNLVFEDSEAVFKRPQILLDWLHNS